MAKLSKIEKFFIGEILFCIIVLVYLGVCALVFFRNKEIELALVTSNQYYLALNELQKDYNENCNILDKSKCREIVEEELNLKCYIYGETDLGDKYNGLTFASIRTILLDDSLSREEYCIVFVHETIHLTEFIADERYVCFATFKYLYEHECEEMHNIGVVYGIQQLRGMYSGEYDIYDLIVDYLTKN